jgi:hypothetical protein
MSKETGGPAFPQHLLDTKSSSGIVTSDEMDCAGMTLRQYAAIPLKVPESGLDWLDAMIRESKRDDFAAKAMQGMAGSNAYCKHGWALDKMAEQAYALADAMLAERQEGGAACKWSLADDGVYKSDCGRSWELTDGTPADNCMIYCHGCGRKIEDTK